MVTIVIPTILKDNFVYKCINSIYQYVKLPIQVHLSIGYDNFSKACNEGAKHTKSKYLLFLNDDIEAKNDFVSLMLNVANKFNCKLVGAKLLYPDNTIQHIGVYYNDKGLPYHKDLKKPNYEIEDCYVPAVTGACILIERELFEKVGGFDEEYIMGFEDIDLCNKVKELGYKIALAAKTKLIHYEKQSRGFNEERFHHNIRRYTSKWLQKY